MPHRLTLALVAAVLLSAVLVGACADTGPASSSSPESGRVARISDGDTLRLADGRRIRLVQIDAPERDLECFGGAATNALLVLAPVGSRVELERDPSLDDRDRHGRLLRYVRAGGRHVNLELVRIGAAAPYFYRGERGRHAETLLRAAKAAQAARRGLWGACPAARLAPTRQIAAGPP
jgi:endonuclease YncB( thermonuclease family)